MRRRYGLLTLAVALVVGAANPVTAAAAPPGDTPPSAPDGAAVPVGSATVTLITGDRVRLDVMDDGTQRAAVVAPVGTSSRYWTHSQGGQTYVVPSAAEPLLAAGRLDRELFNISSLVAQGYDDAHSDTLPLITTYSSRGLAARPAPAGATRTAELSSVNGAAVAESKADAEEFWADVAGTGVAAPRPGATLAGGLTRIWLDARTHATLDESVPQIGGPAAWDRGLDGTGVTVAVLDSGIDPTHPDFAGRIGPSADFTGTDTVDHAGHGTHVSSIVAGSGAASDGRYRGVAPGAELMVGKVLNSEGVGASSWAIEGMEWAASHGATVVNLSLGGPVTRGDDPMSQALNALTDQYGTLFVVAAGNTSFSQPGTDDVTSPASADRALAVGAVSKRDFMWSGSRHGRMGDSAIKPDLVAPGQNITAARAAGTGFGDGAYTTMTGTSMAAPHVSGVAALLAQEHPDWDATRLRAALTTTAAPVPEGRGVYVRGAGRVDADRATAQNVFADTGVLDMGYFAQPFDPDTAVVTRTVTYRNESDAPVTLDLTTDLSTRFGDPAEDGILTVSPDTLELAAGATRTVEVTVDTTSAPANTYSGRVLATSGKDLALSTAVGFYKQDDTVDVTFSANDLNGNPATATLMVSRYKDTDGRYFPEPYYLDPGQTEWTIRLPEGDYNVWALITTFDESGRYPVDQSIVGDPKLEVRAPNFDVHLDATDAVPVELSTPRESEPGALSVEWWRGEKGSPIASEDTWAWSRNDGAPERISVAPTERVDDSPFVFAIAFDAVVPELDASLRGDHLNLVYEGGPQIDGTHRYQVVDAGDGTDPSGLDLSGALALVREVDGVSYAEQVAAVTQAGAAGVILYSTHPGVFWPVVGGPVPVMALPKDQGEALADWAGTRGRRLRVVGTPRSPYAYDVTFPSSGQVPDDQSYRVRNSDVATVRANIHTTGTGERGWRVVQSSIAECGCGPYALTDHTPSVGYTRTEYVTARPDVQVVSAWQYQVGLPANIVYSTAAATYEPGQRVDQDWLKAPLSPGTFDSELPGLGDQASRFDDTMFYSVAGMTDSAGHFTPYMAGTHVSSRLYLGDQALVDVDNFLRGNARDLPTGDRTYRLEADTDHDGSIIGLSTRTHSEWTFHSAGNGGHQVLPLVDVDYTGVRSAFGGRDMLNLANEAPALLPVRLTLRAGHQLGSEAPAVNSTRVWVSYDDGEHWFRAPSWRTGSGEFAAAYVHPPKSWTSGYVSLRVAASDTAGNSLDQTIIRAYKLRGLFPFDYPRVAAM